VSSSNLLESHYESIQKCWNVNLGQTDFGRLVVPTGNASSRFHRWFHLKEAFSSELLEVLLKHLDFDSRSGLRILDPFAGSGTSIVSALEMSADENLNIEAIGIERNPFLHLVSKTKVDAMKSASSLSRVFQDAFLHIENCFIRATSERFEPPSLSTFSKDQYFPDETLQELLRLRASIEQAVPAGLLKDVFLVAASACVEGASRLRRDGRALRFSAARRPRSPWEQFRSRTSEIYEDLKGAGRVYGEGMVLRGDGRQPSLEVAPSSEFDLIFFSPPYPNNIDYTEIYKMEAWYLGCYNTDTEFRSQRLKTVRSHPSIRFGQPFEYETSEQLDSIRTLIEPIINAVPEDRYKLGRIEMIKGYVDDMYKLLRQGRDLIDSDGKLAYVVGNSLHGSDSSSFVIAADVLMGRIGELVGWSVEELLVARRLGRRASSSDFLRESLVIMRPQ
jgi:16S rRNA G966 N2-methylase RsmD